MAKEIERKWIVTHVSPPVAVSVQQQGVHTQQGYLALEDSPGTTVRIRRSGAQGWCTVKQGSGVTRDEFEWPMNAEEASRLLGQLTTPPIEKVRLKIPNGTAHPWELDVFQGHLWGLLFLELELETPDSPLPPWPEGIFVGREVTGDLTNADLAAMSAAQQRDLVARLRASAPPQPRR